MTPEEFSKMEAGERAAMPLRSFRHVLELHHASAGKRFGEPGAEHKTPKTDE
jgi:hypothetical protein